MHLPRFSVDQLHPIMLLKASVVPNPIMLCPIMLCPIILCPIMLLRRPFLRLGYASALDTVVAAQANSFDFVYVLRIRQYKKRWQWQPAPLLLSEMLTVKLEPAIQSSRTLI